MGHFKVLFWKSTFGEPLLGVHLGGPFWKRSTEEVQGRGPRKRSTEEVHERGLWKRSIEEVHFLKSTLGDDFGEPLRGSILEVHIGGPLCSLHISVING